MLDQNLSKKPTIDRNWRLLSIVRGEDRFSYESIPSQVAAMLIFRSVAQGQREAAPDALRGEEFRDLAINTLDEYDGRTGEPSDSYNLDPVRSMLRDAPHTVLDACAEWASAFNLSTSAGRSSAAKELDALIAQVADHSRWTEYYTPTGIVELMVALADPKPGDRVYDPCFGSGGLLVTAARYLAEKSPDRASEIEISGVEVNSSAYVIGLARLLLTGVSVRSLERANTLAADTGRAKHDLILAVPPWGYKQATESAFLQHAMDSLRPGGRAVIALPRGFFFRGQTAALRNRLLSDFFVEGIVSLPERVFGSLTGIPSALLIFSNPANTSTSISENAIRFLDLAHPSNSKLFSVDRSKSVTVTPGGVQEAIRRFHALAPAYDLWEESSPGLIGRSWDRFLSRRGEFELNEFLEELKVADPTIGIFRLADIALIRRGSTRKPLADDTDAEVFPRVPLVTPTDVRDGTVLQPRLQVPLPHSDQQDESDLRAGDVLLSRLGHHGIIRVGLVPEELVGSRAGNGLIVIRSSDTMGLIDDPGYLVTLLSSPTYQLWLSGNAYGTNVQTLSLGTLKMLPIVIPPIHVQALVRSRWRQQGGDGLHILREALLGLTNDPLLDWAKSTLSTFFKEDLDDPASETMSDLKSIVSSYADQSVLYGSYLYEHIGDGSDLAEWFYELEPAFDCLFKAGTFLPTTLRVVWLQRAWMRFQQALDLNADVPNIGGAQPPDTAALLTWHLQQSIEHAIGEELYYDFDIDVWVEPQVIHPETPGQIELMVHNSGGSALYNVYIQVSPIAHDSIDIDLLDIGDTATFTLDAPADIAGATLPLSVSWHATRLDEDWAGGRHELTILYADGPGSPTVDLGTSPYIVGSPVDRPDMLFGREKLLTEIEHQLSGEHGNILFLEGNRRTGKTSILKRLQVDGRLQQVVPVYFDAQGLESLAAGEIFRSLTYEIGMTLHRANHRGWFRDDFPIDTSRPYRQAFRRALSDVYEDESRPFEQFEDYVDLALEEIAPKRLLIMFDEVDKFQDGIDRGEMDSTIFANFRHLLHTNPSLTAIFTGSLRLRRLREDYGSALFGLGQKINVGRLEPESARRLVSDPVQGRLEYSSTARERIVDLCGGQPFLIQQLCNIIFVNAAQSGKAVVDPADIEQSLGRFLENEHFRTVWNNTGVPTQQLLLALCAGIDGKPDPTTVDFLAYRLEDQGIHPSVTSVILDHLEYLTELDLLELTRGSGLPVYRLTVPALAQWIRGNVDENRLFAIVREEV